MRSPTIVLGSLSTHIGHLLAVCITNIYSVYVEYIVCVCVYIALFSPEPFSWAGAEEGEAPALGTVVSVGGVQE